MFWEQFVKLCNERNQKPSAVISELGFGHGSVTWWKNGRIPSSSTLHKIADYFGVTVEYLLGKEEKKAKKRKPLCRRGV